MQNQRVVSGMRPTGALHLGHYHGVIKQWRKLQRSHDCFFFVADWHALTTHYQDTKKIPQSILNTVINWLACGINPNLCTIFVQSDVPEHAELHVLLSMIMPLRWLERVPSYKDMQMNDSGGILATYGFLGYPLLQAADILIYRAAYVPVGVDQVAHVELTREIARRFNHFYGREADFEALVEAAIQKLGKRPAERYEHLRKQYIEKGDEDALNTARALVEELQHLSIGDRERLIGYLSGSGRVILPECEALLTPTSKITGIDGRKMSKSYGNTIELLDSPKMIAQKLKTMQTDTKRISRKDPGNPKDCPVYALHEVYSDESTLKWVSEGCTTASIGCLECKKCLTDIIVEEHETIREKAKPYMEDTSVVRSILSEGAEHARDIARDTLDEVKQMIGIEY